MICLDTSALAKRYLNEAKSDEFEEDLLSGVLVLRRLQDEDVWGAVRLMDRLHGHALRTLDALHLACAAEAEGLATADRTMAEAAEALGMGVERFW